MLQKEDLCARKKVSIPVEKLRLLSEGVFCQSQFQHFEPLKAAVFCSERLWSKLFTRGAAGDEARLPCIGRQTESRQMKRVKGVGKFVLEILRD